MAITNVGKPVRTPEEVLVELPQGLRGESPALDTDAAVDVEMPAGSDEFADQDDILKSLQTGSEQENSDGSVTVDFGGDKPKVESSGEFDENLAEVFDNQTLSGVASECMQAYRDDQNSRKEWEDQLARGLKLLGMAVETMNDPWPNACGVFHPVLLEATLKGWAKSMKDLAPPAGPAKTKIKGPTNSENLKLAARVREEMNSIIQYDIPDYGHEQERMSFMMHLSGSGFKKIYYDAFTESIQDRYVHPNNLIMPYGATNIDMCPRICHRQDMFSSEVRSMQLSKLWRDVSLPQPANASKTPVKEKEDDIAGQKPSGIPNQRRILEFHIELMISGDSMAPDDRAVPYLVVIDESTEEVLRVARNWVEDSKTYKRQKCFVAYQYIPGYSVYGIGMVHIIGGLAEGATSILRQLVDAGTLSNLPAGFKGRGFRVKHDDQPIRPGEWRDVDYAGSKIQDAIMPLPFKEPSSTLGTLLTGLIEEARRSASVMDASIADIGKETPVGSVLAILEESLVVQTAVQVGMLRSLTEELILIKDCIRENMPGDYKYADAEGNKRETDFDDPIAVIPVADPNASSIAQRVVSLREGIAVSQMFPEVVKKDKLVRSYFEALNIQDAKDMVPLQDDIEPADPVTENFNIIKGDPVKVFDHQDHESHIQVHMAAMQDPHIQEMIGQSPNAQVMQASLSAHIAEHVAYAYRSRIEQASGQSLPDPDRPLPPDVERQLSPQLAKAAQQVLAQSKQESQAKQAQALAEDPVVQLKAREVAVKEKDQDRKATEAKARLEIQQATANQQAMIQVMTLIGNMKQADKDRMKDAMFAAKEMQMKTVTELLKIKVMDKAASRPQGASKK